MKESFAAILNNVHNNIEIVLHTFLTAKWQEKDAKEIENTLREIKRVVLKLYESETHPILSPVQEKIKQVLEETLKVPVQGNSFKNPFLLFFRTHNYVKNYSNYGYDDVFEKQFVALIEAMASKAVSPIQISSKIFIGQSNMPIAGFEGFSDEVINCVKKASLQKINLVAKELAKEANLKSYKEFHEVVQASGKADINVPMLKISADASDIISNFLRAVSGKTFTLKNYSSYSYKDEDFRDSVDIKLGNTNLYKSITGALTWAYCSSQEMNSIFFRGMNYISGNLNPEKKHTTDVNNVLLHFYHLRFVYELRGQKDQGKNYADFIIWNDPTTENIIVRSTAQLILKHFKDTKNINDINRSAYGMMFSNITINAYNKSHGVSI